MSDNIMDALKWRYAVQVFDSTKPITDQELHAILEAGRLAPSSFGIEPWKFIVVENPEIRAKLRAVGYGQPKITDASHLIVIARRTDAREHISAELIDRASQQQGVAPEKLAGWKNSVDGAIAGRSDTELDIWVRCQCYIPLGIMIETAALLGVDAGPMEGFNPVEVDKILGLEAKHLKSTSMLALGHRGQDAAAERPKVRRVFEEAVEFVK